MKAFFLGLITRLLDWALRRKASKANEARDVTAESRKRALASRDSRQADILEADRRLFAQITEDAELPHVVAFLDEHNFGDAYPRKRFVWIDNFTREWDQPTREFHTAELQDHLAGFLSHLQALVDGLAQDTYVVAQSPSHNRVPKEWMTEQEERFWSVVKELNRSAEDCVTAYNLLIRHGKELLAV